MAGYNSTKHKYKILVEYLTYLPLGEAWIKAGFGGENPAQACWNLLNRRPDLRAKIDNVRQENLEMARKEKEDYLRLLNDMAFKEGEFAEDEEVTPAIRINAAKTAMKAEGCEGVSKIEQTGGFNLTMNFDYEEEDEDEEE